MSPTVVSKCCNSRKFYSRYSFQCDIIFHSRTFARFRRKKCHSTLARSLDLAQTQSPRQRVLQRCNITSAQSKASTTDRQVSISEYQHVEDGVLIRPAQLSELEDVAWLRAEAYYEDQQHLRYVGSFKRQFMEQETRSLKERTAVKPGSDLPDSVCLVAVEAEQGSRGIMGTLDAEPPSSSSLRQRKDVPQGATYVLNVVVSQRHRRRGIGQALMAAARRLAKEQWYSTHMCTHVSAQNEPAIALYCMCGFQETTEESVLNRSESYGGSLLGKQLFMTAAL